MPSASTDVWASGDAYEPYVGRWSRLVAREFLSWLAAARGARWLDVGCGTGALTGVILSATAPAHVQAIDASLSYVLFARNRTRDRRAAFMIADARSLPLPAQSIDVAVSGLALNFIPQPEVAVAEMARVARAGGVVAMYVWDYAGQMQLMRYFWDAAVALDARASELDEARRFPICHPRWMRSSAAPGFGELRAWRSTCRRSFGISTTTGCHSWADRDRPRVTRWVSVRSAVPRCANESAALPVAADGSIDLVARAWAVRGTRV